MDLRLLPRLCLSSNVLGFDVSKVLVEEFEGASLLRELGEIRLETSLDGLEKGKTRGRVRIRSRDVGEGEEEEKRTFHSSFSARMLAASVRSRSAIPSASIRLSSAW